MDTQALNCFGRARCCAEAEIKGMGNIQNQVQKLIITVVNLVAFAFEEIKIKPTSHLGFRNVCFLSSFSL